MKLVRDKIPQIIAASGRSPRFYIADKPEHLSLLYDKMSEEIGEFRENPCVEEAADMLEVVYGLCHIHGISVASVIATSTVKRTQRGSFDGGVVLEGVKADEDR